jgi:hypothetical protein
MNQKYPFGIFLTIKWLRNNLVAILRFLDGDRKWAQSIDGD